PASASGATAAGARWLLVFLVLPSPGASCGTRVVPAQERRPRTTGRGAAIVVPFRHQQAPRPAVRRGSLRGMRLARAAAASSHVKRRSDPMAKERAAAAKAPRRPVTAGSGRDFVAAVGLGFASGARGLFGLLDGPARL